ncbi:hypothetical protein NST38_12950 [Paenibacillus sp. FSL H8-0104]|uniref:hypothetical protein n=1 Tax=Paenibacillus sp. FSL H8-0104 TaxID=2954509 RepID=UPI0030FD58F3
MIEQSIIDFESKISFTPSEKDAIMLINIANLHLINKDYTRFEDILVSLKTQILINNEDQFYDYYLTNLELIKSLLQHDWLLAEKLLAELKNKLPEFHKKNIKKMKNRIIALEKMIAAQIMLDPLLLDQWVYDHSA